MFMPFYLGAVSHIAQTDLEILILLPLPTKCLVQT